MLLMLALHGFSACNNYSEVKSFMTELSAAVSAHDTTAISKMFPEAWKADSLSLSFDIDDIHIEKLENGNYLVVLDDGRDITISKNETENSHMAYLLIQRIKLFLHRTRGGMTRHLMTFKTQPVCLILFLLHG